MSHIENFPRGIAWDPARRRYRIRLYFRKRVVWLSYTRDLTVAEAEYRKAIEHRKMLTALPDEVRGIDGYITAIKLGQI